MRILGLSSFTYNSAVAILEDGVIKSAIENDKVVGRRTHGLPEAAINSCLQETGAGCDQVCAQKPLPACLPRQYVSGICQHASSDAFEGVCQLSSRKSCLQPFTGSDHCSSRIGCAPMLMAVPAGKVWVAPVRSTYLL